MDIVNSLSSPASDNLPRNISPRDPDSNIEPNPQSRASSCSSRSHARHKRSSTKLLKQWFALHASWPYPTQAEKEFLSRQTGMSTKQISSWFVNTRRRNGPKLAETWLPSTSQSSSLLSRSAPVDMPSRNDRVLQTIHSSQWGNMTPMDRWRDSPPEEDHVSFDTVARAIQDAPVTFPGGNGSARRAENYAGLESLSSYDFPSSDASSNSSAHSQGLASTSGSFTDFESRSWKGKRWSGTKLAYLDTPHVKGGHDLTSRPYQCTFCTDRFKSRYDWTRHEQTLHLILEQWKCLPFGLVYTDPTQGASRCVLCDTQDPTDAHMAGHHAIECTSRHPSARTFFRKDHLRQHLRFAHGIDKMIESMDSWRTKEDRVKSRCGFCGDTFTMWSERNDHLADHFRVGADMKDWKGCRGLEPAVALRVDNAMPPYLIGLEAADPDPFSASRGTTKRITSLSNNGVQCVAPTSFESLTARLGDYVRIARENSLDLSDQALRRQARLILYEDDDSWNQTPADNAEWLGMFKSGYGLNGENQSLTRTVSTTAKNQSLATETGPFTTQNLRQAAGCDHAMLPFYFEHLEEAVNAADANAPDGKNTTSLSVPWSWQTPECLVEFSQFPDPNMLLLDIGNDDLGMRSTYSP